MSLKDDLASTVKSIFKETWSKREGTVVPESDDLKLSNDAVTLEATVLYADLSGSTKLVDTQERYFAAEIYKTYLHCAAKIIRDWDGAITAYDGDRIMAVYIGGSKNTNAAQTALRINYARIHIINPALKEQYSNSNYQVEHSIGIDTSDLFVARTGIRGSNDLVWVGRAANYAAKLAALSPQFPSRMTEDVYDAMNKKVKLSEDGKSMWEKATWKDMNDMTIYRSTWWRTL